MTRVIVTHHVHFLPRRDRVLVMEKGEIQHFDTYANLVSNGVVFAGAVDFYEHKNEDDKNEQSENEDGEDEKVADTYPKNTKKMKENGQKLISKEERQEGSISG